MKSILTLSLFAAITFALPGRALTQIRDDEASMATLAVQCSVSSGYSAKEFEDYSRNLAKTLALLNGPQQFRVFGYLPQPGSANPGARAGVEPISTQSVEKVSGASKESGLIVGLVGDLNNTIDGVRETSGGIYGETNSMSDRAAEVSNGNAIGSEQSAAVAGSSSGNTSLSDVIEWIFSWAAKLNKS